jgi:hypothetical protein
MIATYHRTFGSDKGRPRDLSAGFRLLNALLVACVIAMSLGYLVMINRSATKGFIIKAIEQRISGLEEERKRLDLETLASQSMENIESRVGDLGFVPVSSIDFVNGAGGAVAIR